MDSATKAYYCMNRPRLGFQICSGATPRKMCSEKRCHLKALLSFFEPPDNVYISSFIFQCVITPVFFVPDAQAHLYRGNDIKRFYRRFINAVESFHNRKRPISRIFSSSINFNSLSDQFNVLFLTIGLA